MKLFIVGYEHPMCDKRVKRTVIALSKSFEVSYQYLERGNENKACENDLENVDLLPVKHPGKSKSFFHWTKKWTEFDQNLLNMILKSKADIVYFHQVPFTMNKMLLKLKNAGIKIIYDAHEIFPDQFLYGRNFPFERLYRKHLWRKYKKFLQLADKIIFVSEEAKEYVFEKTGVGKEYLVIPNLAEYSMKRFLPFQEREKCIVIVGGTRRLVPIEYIKAILNAGYDVKVIGNIEIVGSGEVKVTKMPFLPYDEMMKEISKATFTLNAFLPLKGNFNIFYSNHVFSLPHKFYDSLAAGTPVLVHEYFTSMKKVVKKDGIGAVVKSPNELKIFLSRLIATDYSKLLKNIGANSENYFWNRKWEERLVKFVKN